MSAYLTAPEVAALSRKSLRTIRALTAAGRIPHRKMRGCRNVLYPKAEILYWIDTCCELEVEHLRDGGRVCRPKLMAAA